MFRKKSTQGFSLVEMVVSLMIFSVVAVIALGAMIKIVSVNKKAQALMSSITNINFALDIMSRELSLASSVHCNDTISPSTNTEILTSPPTDVACESNFSAKKSLVVVFQTPNPGTGCTSGQTLSNAYFFHIPSSSAKSFTLEKAEQTSCTDSFGSSNAPFVPVTASEVTLNDFSVKVSYDPLAAPAQKYPLTFVHLSGFAGVSELEKTYFDVQTAVSLAKPQE